MHSAQYEPFTFTFGPEKEKEQKEKEKEEEKEEEKEKEATAVLMIQLLAVHLRPCLVFVFACGIEALQIVEQRDCSSLRNEMCSQWS